LRVFNTSIEKKTVQRKIVKQYLFLEQKNLTVTKKYRNALKIQDWIIQNSHFLILLAVFIYFSTELRKKCSEPSKRC
jgi:hypothetical protein